MWGYVAGEGNSKIGARAPGPPEKRLKIVGPGSGRHGL